MSVEHIFRAYDIRGRVGVDLTPDVISKACAVYANMITEWGGRRVSLAGDGRTSTPMLMSAALSGLVAGGVDVELIGQVPISIANWWTWRHERLHGGVYVTASHNPPDWNGIRFRFGDGCGFAEENQEIKRRVFANEVKWSSWDAVGRVFEVSTWEVLESYLAFCLSLGFRAERKLRIVLDTRNGIAGVIVPRLFRALGFDVVPVNANVDGHFPCGSPDPVHADLSDTIAVMKSVRADMAIAYDGDGDRAVVIDDRGRVFPAEGVGILVAREVLKPGDVVVYNAECSSMLREVLEQDGFKCVECRVGDVFVAKAIKKHKARLGVEGSFHFFPAWLGFAFDDAILISAVFASIISRQQKPLSEILDELRPWHLIKENIPCSDELKWKVVDKFREVSEAKYGRDKISTVDGVKIYLEGASALVRPSNTEPVIRIRTEARSEERARELHREIVELLRKVMSEVA